MKRRTMLLTGGAAWPALWSASAAAAAAPVATGGEVERLATAWRASTGDGGTPGDGGDRVGVFEVDWAAGRVALLGETAVPTRAHGLLALADGGFLAVALRPGRWLLRADATGRVQQRLDLDAAGERRTLNGHVVAGPDGRWLFTTETDPTDDSGWIAVRDARTLARVAEFRSHGVDAHQLLPAADGTLLVANGGIARDALGRKRAGVALDSSLVRLGAASGRLLGQWRLADRALSIRHLAWAHGERPLLGVALQAEHEQAADRAAAPVLAVWDGERLAVPAVDARAGGYAGDIAAAPGGGFVISAQKQGRCLWWHPGEPEAMTLVAELRQPCALAPGADGTGVSIGAGRGLARWHARLAPRMMAWPLALAPDNHWVRLAGG